MDKLYARSVFFVDDAERSQRFYKERLGFAMDWSYEEEGRTFVCQVSLFGFELILNQAHDKTRARVGHGRVFIGLDDDQGEPLRQHIVKTGIPTQRVDWGRPTLVVRDLDANELYFWLPHDDFTGFAASAIEASGVVEPMRSKDIATVAIGGADDVPMLPRHVCEMLVLGKTLRWRADTVAPLR